jgi:hypothetical protein
MGRPIASKYFGNRNTDGVGGEGVSGVTIQSAGTGYFTANAAVTFSAPQIAGGSTATGTVSLNGSGNVTGVVITSSGTGYTSAPTAVFTGANTSPASANVVSLTSSVSDAITASAFLAAADGGSSAVASDIVKQVGARRYTVRNAQGTGKVRLVTSAPAAGEMRITATDSDSGTYYVKKLESRTVTLLPATGTQFVEDQQVVWSLDSAEDNVSVVIANN